MRRVAFSDAVAPVSSSTSASSPACCEVAGRTRAGFSESSQARSAAMITLEELGSDQHLLGRHVVDPGQQLVGRWIRRPPAGDDVGAEVGEQILHPLAGCDGEGAGAPGAEPGAALGDLLAHIGDVEIRDTAGGVEEGDGGLGLVGVDMDLQGRLVADNEDGVAQPLEG